MFRPTPMQELNILVLDTDIDIVTQNIIEAGLLHLLRVDQLEDWAKEDLEPVAIEANQTEFSHLSTRIDNILKKLLVTQKKKVHYLPSAKKFQALSPEYIKETLDEIESEANKATADELDKEKQLSKLQDISRHMANLTPLGLKIEPSKYTFLETVIGKINGDNLDIIYHNLKDIPNVVLPFKSQGKQMLLLAIVLKQDKAVLDKACKEANLEEITAPEEAPELSKEAQDKIKEKIQKLNRDVLSCKKAIGDLRHKYLQQLTEYSEYAKANQLILKAKKFFAKSEKTYLISGWIPYNKKDILIENIQAATSNRCYIEANLPEELKVVKERKIEIPVTCENPAFFKPFELLTFGYAIPAYNTVDPTFFVGISFLIMFGAMFGDVGHGLILFLLGLFLLSKAKQKVVFAKVGTLIIYCAASSILFGFLYGSLFGFENILPTLWTKPIHNITNLFTLSILFGIVMISIGIIINIINAIRTHDIVEGIFDKSGLIGGLIYWVCIGFAINYFITKSVNFNPMFVVVPVVVLLVSLFFKAPIAKLFRLREKLFPEGLGNYLVDTSVEIMEIIIGYLTNTLSFIRIAAFALAHAGLFIAVFSLADLVKTKSGGNLSWLLVLIFGNLFIVALEGLIVSIQGVRLEYYEFFSKFFKKTGKPYKPISLKEG